VEEDAQVEEDAPADEGAPLELQVEDLNREITSAWGWARC
jgi:hypothetical protein